jgi:ADP-ribose pyrophosphatase YjhB (NUDIX family)
MTDKPRRGSFITKVLRPWWRLTRGLTLGAQGVVVDASSKVLLVRHGYRPGWHFPGGGVERNETLLVALERELEEETGVAVEAQPELHGLFSNGDNFPGDHIALFIIREWVQPEVPKPNAEIVEQGFFAVEDVPDATDLSTRRRLAELFNGKNVSDKW